MKQNSFKPSSKDEIELDVHNDQLMVKIGIRVKPLEPKDLSAWEKTSYERKTLKALKHSYKGETHFHSIPSKSIPVRGKLIIYLLRNKRFPKTTYSIECWQHEISEILSKYVEENRKDGSVRSLVKKYSFNERTFKPEERPFWK